MAGRQCNGVDGIGVVRIGHPQVQPLRIAAQQTEGQPIGVVLTDVDLARLMTAVGRINQLVESFA